MREGYRSCFACFQWNKNFNLNHTHSNIKRIDDKWYIIIYLYNLKVVFALPFLQNMKYATTPISTSSTIITTVVTRARNFWFCTSIKREKRYASRFPVYRFSLFHWKRKKKGNMVRKNSPIQVHLKKMRISWKSYIFFRNSIKKN